jgi:D-amino-acid dehydrogenase
VVVESNRVGSGASWGNGGWLCPAQAGPLPEPGLTLYGMRSLFDAESALYFKPGNWPELVPWLARFWTYCNERDHRHGVEAIAELGRDVFDLVEAMEADGVEFELHRQGMLVATKRAADARKELAKLAPMRARGYELPDDVITGDELHSIEPALASEVSAGFVVPQHWHVRPESFTEGLARAVKAMGVKIVEGAEVIDVEAGGGRVRGLRTPLGTYTADAFLLAAGAWTPTLTQMVGVRFPMQAGKGYSFFVTPTIVPRHSIVLPDIHVGCTPLGDRMRIGGTLEFSGLNTRLDRGKIASIARGARSSFVPWQASDIDTEWAGLRPITPDGLPVLDRADPFSNLYVATGYSMQGMTLGPPAGVAMAEYVATGRKPDVLSPFGLDRLRGLRWPGRTRHGSN